MNILILKIQACKKTHFYNYYSFIYILLIYILKQIFDRITHRKFVKVFHNIIESSSQDILKLCTKDAMKIFNYLCEWEIKFLRNWHKFDAVEQVK